MTKVGLTAWLSTAIVALAACQSEVMAPRVETTRIVETRTLNGPEATAAAMEALRSVIAGPRATNRYSGWVTWGSGPPESLDPRVGLTLLENQSSSEMGQPAPDRSFEGETSGEITLSCRHDALWLTGDDSAFSGATNNSV